MTLTRQEREFRILYRKFLREMKKENLKIEDMPENVAQSALIVHQEALRIETKRRRQP